MSENQELNNKKIIISGGTTGIGRATAILLAADKAKILIFGREQAPLDETLDIIRKNGGEAIGVTADVSKPEDIERIFQLADEELGGVDVLISNAALAALSIVDTPPAEQEYVIKTNLMGYMLTSHQAIKRMKIKKQGQIVFVGSMSADVREEGSSLYVATKSAIQGLAEALRKEINPMGITVALIEPGEVGSDMNPNPPEKQREKQAQLTQMKAEDIADIIKYVLTRNKRVDIVELKVRPHLQLI